MRLLDHMVDQGIVVRDAQRTIKRQCGDCQLCCRLLPVRALPLLDKGAGINCQFQKFHKGCTVYRTPKMPSECVMWNCRWLVNDDADDLSRPDRSHYVLDIMPDFITLVDDDTGTKTEIQVAQVWNDPRHPDAHRDPKLRAWMFRRAEQGVASIVRYNNHDAFTIFAPPLAGDGEWHEVSSSASVATHTPEQVFAALGNPTLIVEE